MKTVPLNTAFRDLGKYISRNSPSILTGLGIGLGVASTVLAVTATPKAVRLLEEKKNGWRLLYSGDTCCCRIDLLRRERQCSI